MQSGSELHYLHLIVLFSILTDTTVTSTSTATNTPTPTPCASSVDVTLQLGECTLLMDVQYIHTHVYHTVAGVSWE